MWPRVPYASVMLDIAQIHLGDLPTWLAGLGTVGTLGAALWQIGSERKRRIEREAQEREEWHQAQARLIAAVIGPEEPLVVAIVSQHETADSGSVRKVAAWLVSWVIRCWS